MRFAHQRISPNKQYINNSSSKNIRKNMNSRIDTENTYMHYNNAIYMGNMVSYKRNGQGIMLFDQGTSAIIDYSFDTMVGHNIFFNQNAIASVLHIKKGSYEIVLRTSQFIFKIPFYENQHIPNGNGLLIDYKDMKIYHLIYSHGKISRKIVQSNKDIILNVSKQQLKYLLDIKHEETFRLQPKLYNGIQVVKKQNKIMFGYFDNHNNLQGVGFKLHIDENNYDNFLVNLQIKCIEKGFYQNSRLQNFGQRYFSNGNLYVGQFLNDSFQGKGLLIYPTQTKWVYGQFQKQKLIKMIQMSLGQPISLNGKITKKSCLKRIHQLNTNNWINTKIQPLNWQSIFYRLQEAIELIPTDIVIEKQKAKRQEEERLYQIQKHFSLQDQNTGINKILKTQKDVNNLSPMKLILNQYNSMKAKLIDIEPRTVQNQQCWSIQKCSKGGQNDRAFQRKFNKKYEIYLSQKQSDSNNKKRLTPVKTSSSPYKIISKHQPKINRNSNLYNSVQY